MPEAPERLGRLEWRMDRVEAGVANFIEFQKDAREFFTLHAERERSAEDIESKRHSENQTKINLILAITAIVGCLLTAAGVYVTYQVSKHSEVIPIKILHSQSNEPVLSYFQHPPQISTLPSMR